MVFDFAAILSATMDSKEILASWNEQHFPRSSEIQIFVVAKSAQFRRGITLQELPSGILYLPRVREAEFLAQRPNMNIANAGNRRALLYRRTVYRPL